MKTEKTYKGQALAIVMIILVVASIIGFSVGSRLITQRRDLIQERESSEALEVTDMILDNMLLYKPEEWVNAGMPNVEYLEKFETTNITDLTVKLKEGNKLDLQNLSICPLSENNNVYTLKLSRTNEDTVFTLRPGETFVFPIHGKSLGNKCSINVNFVNPSVASGFTVNKIYIETGGIKAYDYPDTLNYCFSNSSTTCGNTNFTSSNGWSVFSPTKTLDLTIPSVAPYLERIQLTAIGNNDLSFKFSMSTCTEKIQLWQLRASATCNGTYRAKEVIVPDVGWSYSIFNYVFFNGKGNISSSQ